MDRARVVRIQGKQVWVELVRSARLRQFGPCEVYTPAPIEVGDEVFCARVDGVSDDLVVIGVLQTGFDIGPGEMNPDEMQAVADMLGGPHSNLIATYDPATGKITLSVPTSTKEAVGVIRTATNEETVEGLATSPAVTPAGLKLAIDASRTTGPGGLDVEAVQDTVGAMFGGSHTNLVATYDDVSGFETLEVPNATTGGRGAVQLATNTQTVTGTATTLATTPAGVKAAMDAAIAAAAAAADLDTVLADSPQIVNVTTLTNDTQLVAALDASSFYEVQVRLVLELEVGGSTTTDLKVGWTFPAGVTGYWAQQQVWSQPGAAGTSNGLLAALSANRDFTLQEGVQGLTLILLVYTGTTAGNLQMQFAQNTAAAGIDITRYAGSNMLVRKLNPNV